MGWFIIFMLFHNSDFFTTFSFFLVSSHRQESLHRALPLRGRPKMPLIKVCMFTWYIFMWDYGYSNIYIYIWMSIYINISACVKCFYWMKSWPCNQRNQQKLFRFFILLSLLLYLIILLILSCILHYYIYFNMISITFFYHFIINNFHYPWNWYCHYFIPLPLFIPGVITIINLMK